MIHKRYVLEMIEVFTDWSKEKSIKKIDHFVRTLL